MVFQLLAQETTNQSGQVFGLALPVLMIVGFYFLLIRPQRTRQRKQQAILSSLEVRDEIMTTGGIFGTIVEIDEEEGILTVEIAPGTTVRMVRQGVAQRFVEDDEVYEDDQAGDDREP